MPIETVTIAFNAFIHRKVTPLEGKWAFEPITGKGGTGPGGGKNTISETETQFAGDGRGFNEAGTSRICHTITLSASDIGHLSQRRPYGDWICSKAGKSHQRTRQKSGNIMQGPGKWSPWRLSEKTAPDKSKIGHVKDDRIKVEGEASYPFAPLGGLLAPDIDYSLEIVFKLQQGGINILVTGEHNLFPFYELIVNRKLVWKYEPTDSGPGLINLNRSKKFRTSFDVKLMA